MNWFWPIKQSIYLGVDHMRHKTLCETQKSKLGFKKKNVKVVTFPGNVLIEPFSLQTQSGNPYQVYTPFSKAYFARPDLGIDPIPAPKNRKDGLNFIETLSLEDLNLLPSSPNWAIEFSDYWIPGEEKCLGAMEKFCA
jgi:deoxyribodipyrimidine photo-lyase